MRPTGATCKYTTKSSHTHVLLLTLTGYEGRCGVGSRVIAISEVEVAHVTGTAAEVGVVLGCHAGHT